MTKVLFIFFLTLACTDVFGQSIKSDSTKVFVYEICVFRKAKPGHIIKNEIIGIADTTVAIVTGEVLENDEPIAFTSVSFTNASGHDFGTTTDVNGKYKIILNSNSYSVKFFSIGYNELKVEKLKLGTGQMQELNVDLGPGGGFHTYEVTFDHKPTNKELKAKEKELARD